MFTSDFMKGHLFKQTPKYFLNVKSKTLRVQFYTLPPRSAF